MTLGKTTLGQTHLGQTGPADGPVGPPAGLPGYRSAGLPVIGARVLPRFPAFSNATDIQSARTAGKGLHKKITGIWSCPLDLGQAQGVLVHCAIAVSVLSVRFLTHTRMSETTRIQTGITCCNR